MSEFVYSALIIMEVFFLLYLLFYASYLLLSVAIGAWRLYQVDRMRTIKNELKHSFYFPVSVLVPAHISSTRSSWWTTAPPTTPSRCSSTTFI